MLIDNEDKTLIEKKLSSEPIFDGVLLHVRKDEVELPNGHKSVREWIQHPGASAVIPLLPDNQGCIHASRLIDMKDVIRNLFCLKI